MTSTDDTHLATILSAPRSDRNALADKMGYDHLICAAVAAHDDPREQRKAELARLIHDLFYRMAFDPGCPPPAYWSDFLRDAHARFYRASPFEVAVRLLESVLDAALMNTKSIAIMSVVAILILLSFLPLSAALWMFYPLSGKIALWLNRQYGPYTWHNGL